MIANKRIEILFVLNALDCGGIEKSALSLLSALVAFGCNVTLMMARKEGMFLPLVPKEVKVEEIPYSLDARMEMRYGQRKWLAMLLKRFRLITAFQVLVSYLISRFQSRDGRAILCAKRFCKGMNLGDKVYDMAIAYSELTELYFVAEKVNAQRKALWLHTELHDDWANLEDYLPHLRKMDRFYCVSQSLTASVKVKFPEFQNQVFYFPHLIDGKLIRSLAEQDVVDWEIQNDGLKLLSVGRFSKEKGFDLIPLVARRLKDDGLKFSWMILGTGAEKENLQALITMIDVADCVFLHDAVVNPCPFYKTCDVYVQPSKYDGYCLTLAEARMLYKPIVATSFIGALDQLRNDETGLIVDFSVDALYAAVKTLLVDGEKRQVFEANLRQEDATPTDVATLLFGA